MTPKEFLSQAFLIDKQIQSKLDQLASCREAATRITAALSPVVPGGTRNVHRREDVLCKAIQLEEEVQSEVNRLIDLKRSISEAISAVKNDQYRTLLELRYLSFKSWDEISEQMQYIRRYVFILHRKALDCVIVPKEATEKQ